MNHLFQLFPRTEKTNTNSSPQLLSCQALKPITEELGEMLGAIGAIGAVGKWASLKFHIISSVNVKSCEIDEHESSWKNVWMIATY